MTSGPFPGAPPTDFAVTSLGGCGEETATGEPAELHAARAIAVSSTPANATGCDLLMLITVPRLDRIRLEGGDGGGAALGQEPQAGKA